MIYLDLRPAHRLWTCLDVPEAPTDQAKRLCATPCDAAADYPSRVHRSRLPEQCVAHHEVAPDEYR